MTDKTCPTILKFFVAKSRHERGKLGVDRLFDQLARAIADDIRERVRAKSAWIGQLGDG